MGIHLIDKQKLTNDVNQLKFLWCQSVKKFHKYKEEFPDLYHLLKYDDFMLYVHIMLQIERIYKKILKKSERTDNLQPLITLYGHIENIRNILYYMQTQENRYISYIQILSGKYPGKYDYHIPNCKGPELCRGCLWCH